MARRRRSGARTISSVAEFNAISGLGNTVEVSWPVIGLCVAALAFWAYKMRKPAAPATPAAVSGLWGFEEEMASRGGH